MVWAILNPAIHASVSEFADNPSDRACAIVGAAMVEEALHRALELRLRPDGKRVDGSQINDARDFFSVGGPMGEFTPKIKMAYLLGMMDEAAFTSMKAMATVRNRFAHLLEVKSFDHPKITGHLDNLILHTVYNEYPHPLHDGSSGEAVEPIPTGRDRFIVNARLMLVLLMRDTRLHIIHSNQFQPLPAPPV